MAGSGSDYLGFLSSSTLTSADTFSGGTGTDTVTFAGSAAQTLNTATYAYFSGFETFSITNNVSGNNLIFDDIYYTRSGFSGSTITVTYNFSGTATNGILVDGRLITNSTYTLNVTGDEAADTIYGGDGGDSISAGDGNDIVYGDAGDDTLNGGMHADTIYGGNGNDLILSYSGAGHNSDTISGGSGNDTIQSSIHTASSAGANHQFTGGTGTDDFVFSNVNQSGFFSVGEAVIITDFSGSSGDGDKIDLSAIIAGTFTFAGSIAQGSSGSAFAADDSVRYYQDTGGNRTIIQITVSTADANASTTDMEIELTGLITLTTNEFVL